MRNLIRRLIIWAMQADNAASNPAELDALAKG
jgi:hypothetical protein